VRRVAIALATIGALAVSGIAAPTPAQARWGFGPGWGPGYGDYDGYAPPFAYAAYYYGYPADYGGASIYFYFAPADYGYRYRRAFRPAFAYYRGPRYAHHWHHGRH
jgi:hypothetical protein